MATEQRGCRETLRVHSEGLSVREQRETEERSGGGLNNTHSSLCAVFQLFRTKPFSVSLIGALHCTHPCIPLLKATAEDKGTGYIRIKFQPLIVERQLTIIFINRITYLLFSVLLEIKVASSNVLFCVK